METQMKLEHKITFRWLILSFCRTIIFMVIPVLVLPQILGMDGVWLSITAGEVMSLGMCIYYFVKFHEMWKAPGKV